jgi:hypothetical protein
MRKRSEDSIAAALAWGSYLVEGKGAETTEASGKREMIWASFGRERGEERRTRRECWSCRSISSQQCGMSSIFRQC